MFNSEVKWLVEDTWETVPNDKRLGRDRQILVLSEDTAHASICHVASVPADAPQAIHDREMSNARLIASTPDMLAALLQAKEALETSYDVTQVDSETAIAALKSVCAAIAKAGIDPDLCRESPDCPDHA